MNEDTRGPLQTLLGLFYLPPQDRDGMAILDRIYRDHGSPVDDSKIDLALEEGLAECRHVGIRYPPAVLRRKADAQRGKFPFVLPKQTFTCSECGQTFESQ